MQKKNQKYAKVCKSVTKYDNMLKYSKACKSMCNKQKKSYIIQEPGMLEMLKNK